MSIKLTISVPDDMLQRLKARAKSESRSVSKMASLLLEYALMALPDLDRLQHTTKVQTLLQTMLKLTQEELNRLRMVASAEALVMDEEMVGKIKEK